MFQRPGQPGLEILTPDGKGWAPVPVIPTTTTTSSEEGKGEGGEEFPFPPILVNIGDLLSYWTDGLLKSTVHRVVFPTSEQQRPNAQDRYSIVYFCHPLDRTELVPVPSRVVEEFRKSKRSEEKDGGEGGAGVRVGFGGGAGMLEEGKRALTAQEHLMARLDATYGFRRGEKEE